MAQEPSRIVSMPLMPCTLLTADTPEKRTVLELSTKEVAGSANSRQGV